MASLLAEVRKRGIGPTNYLRVCKPHADIDGQYALDLAMPPLLQSAYDGVLISKQNRNLLLESSKGSISAEIWVIPDPSGNSKRASMTLLSQTGPVKAKVVRLSGVQFYFPPPSVLVIWGGGYACTPNLKIYCIALPRRREERTRTTSESRR